VLRQDYVRTAWAKGFRRRGRAQAQPQERGHPVVTIFGIQFAQIFSATVIIENIFQLPGVDASSSTPFSSATTRSSGHQSRDRVDHRADQPHRGSPLRRPDPRIRYL
jgi:hypothetical protein